MAPLDGIRVLALEQYYAGNVGSLMLTRLGAEVVKLEMPGAGDVLRNVGPAKVLNGRRRGVSELRNMLGKKSIALNLGTPEGIAAFWRLVPSFDVVWTNMKPSSLRKLGITFDKLKAARSDIVYATLSGFGHDDLVDSGPFGDWTAFDLIAQGLGGLQYRAEGIDGKPGYNGLALGDLVTALYTVIGTLAALSQRAKTDEAQRVDVAMHDAMIAVNELSLGLLAFTGSAPPRGRSGTSSPYGAYRTKDGYLNVAVGGTPVWRRFCAAIGQPEVATDPRYAESHARVKNYEELDRFVESWTSQHTSLEATEILHKYDVPSAPVFDLPEVLDSPQAAARRMFIEVDDPVAGRQRIIGNPVKLSGVDDRTAPPPPDVGENTRQILRELAGYSNEEIDSLAEAGACGLPAATEEPRAVTET